MSGPLSSPITTLTSEKGWAPDQVTFAPTDAVPDALILQCSTVSGNPDGDEPLLRCPFVKDDEAGVTAEGVEIDESIPELAECLVATCKITQIVKISNEQYGQTNTASQLSQSVARAVTRKANELFVSQIAPTPPALAPAAGLVNVIDIIPGEEVSESLDALVDLVAILRDNLSTPSHILVDPLGWGQISKLKTAQNFNSALLGAGTQDTTQRLLGLSVIIDPAVPDYSGIVLDRNSIVSAVGAVKVSTSGHQLFSQDSQLLRCTWRVGHNVVRPERLGTFTIAGGGS